MSATVIERTIGADRAWVSLTGRQRRELIDFVAKVMGPPEPQGIRSVEYVNGPEPAIRVTRFAFDRGGKHLIGPGRTLAVVVDDYPLRVTVTEAGELADGGDPVPLPTWWVPA